MEALLQTRYGITYESLTFSPEVLGFNTVAGVTSAGIAHVTCES